MNFPKQLQPQGKIFLNMKKRSAVGYLLLSLRGLAMGSADVIPGVSGGTIAFITGIYEELIASIKSINLSLIKTLFNEGIKAAWSKINGNFLLAVVLGILVSIFSLARVISWLLANHPMLVWAFFFGLIIGSAIYIGRKIDHWSAGVYLFLVIGSSLAYYVTIATPATTPESRWFIFLSGAIALCALILPGISGAFILVLLGKYEFMLNAVRDLETGIIAIFTVGGIIGVIAFSNIISWLFKKHHNVTLALLSGFMIGSLNKLWPWKKVLEWRTSSLGEQVPVIEQNILPGKYAGIYDQDPLILPVIISAVAGVSLIMIFMIWTRKKGEERL